MTRVIKLMVLLVSFLSIPFSSYSQCYDWVGNESWTELEVIGVYEGQENVVIEDKLWRDYSSHSGGYYDVVRISDAKNSLSSGLHIVHTGHQKSDVKSVKMSSSIRYIGYEALESLDIKEIDIPDRCATVGDGAFRNCVLLERVSFGTGVSSLFSGEYKGDSRGETFKGCTSLRLIESYAKVPPLAYENTFEGVPVDECVLVVPRGTVEAYRRSPAFGVFKNIKERTYTPIGIEDVNDDSAINFNGGLLTSGKDGLSLAVYSVDGRQAVSRVLSQGESIELPGRGIYIVVADGKSRKITY